MRHLRAIPLALAAYLAAAPQVEAAALQCLGLAPGFMLSLDGDEARFDYLGDGRCRLDPALPDPLPDYLRTRLDTFGAPVPVFIERADCAMLGARLPFRVEIVIETSDGLRPLRGCCRVAADPE